MSAELHIRLHEDVEDPLDVVAGFPFEAGQNVIAQNRELIVIDLGKEEDSTPVQDWYLNAHDDVFSFYVVSDDDEAAEDEPPDEDAD